MLTGITLENFKAFKEPQFIPIKRITLVYGPNNAGKSSIIQALAFLKHVNDTLGNCDPMTVDYGDESLYLGSWLDLVHGHNQEATMRISLHFENCCIRWSFGWHEHGPKILSFIFFNNEKPIDEEAIARGVNSAGVADLKWSVELHSKHPFWGKYKSLIWKTISEFHRANHIETTDDDHDSPEERKCLHPEKDSICKKIESLKDLFDSAYETWSVEEWHQIPVSYNTNSEGNPVSLFPGLANYFSRPEWNTLHEAQGISPNYDRVWFNCSENELEQYSKQILEIFKTPDFGFHPNTIFLDRMLSKVGMAEETILQRHNVETMFSAGYYDSPITHPYHVGAFRKEADLLLKRNASNKKKKHYDDGFFCSDMRDFYGVNKALKQLEVDYTIEDRIVMTVSFKPGEVKLDDFTKAEVHHSDTEIVCVDKFGKSHSLLSVGSGVSVILPIIIALVRFRSNFLSIEEPESHIHPRLQANLADIIISSTMSEAGAQTLVETHSEHLILRILRRIRETTEKDYSDWSDDLIKACPNGLRPEDVSVLYVKPGEDGAQVEPLRINELGEFVDEWPGGFFDERIREIL
jgi:predicted ATPase